MSSCPRCGRSVQQSAFCGFCGSPLNQQSPAVAQQAGHDTASGVPTAHRGLARLLLGAVAVLLTLIVAGVAIAVTTTGGDERATTVVASASPTELEPPSPEPLEEITPELSEEPLPPLDEPTPEPPSCSEQQIAFRVVEQGFTFFAESEQSQVSYAVVLKNPSTTCAASSALVSLDFLTASGDVIATEQVPLGIVPPGGLTALAETTFIDERPAKMEFGKQEATGTDPPAGVITASNVRQLQGAIGTKFTGRLRSTLEEPVSARVAVVLRRNGKLIGGAFTYRDLPHRGTGAFEALTLASLPKGIPTAYVTW